MDACEKRSAELAGPPAAEALLIEKIWLMAEEKKATAKRKETNENENAIGTFDVKNISKVVPLFREVTRCFEF